MSKYRELRKSPPKLEICKTPREVILKTVSCMCDNIHTIRFKKNKEGDFRMSGCGFALSNWGMKHSISDIEWAADANDWETVFIMVNSGSEAIREVKSR